MLNIRLTDSEQFLVECIKHRDFLDVARIRILYRQLSDAKAFELCSHNRIVSLAADALACAGIKPSYRWQLESNEMDSRISEYMDELDRSADLLFNNGIALIALKNSGIARTLYQFPRASPMGDIDVLVHKQDFRRAHDLLVSHGYILKFRSPLEEEDIDIAERNGGAEYIVQLPSKRQLWFELQWRSVAGRWIRPDQEPDTFDLFQRSLPIPGSKARILSPEDNLLQVALHTAKHSFVRAPGFRLHTDVDRIVRSCHIDWDLFISRVEVLKIRTPVFFSLAFAHDLLDTPIPYHVLQSLSPSKWKTTIISNWLQRVGLFDPDGRKWGRFSYILFVSLLYDSFSGFLVSLFPSPSSILHKNLSPIHSLIFYYQRIQNLLFKRSLAPNYSKRRNL